MAPAPYFIVVISIFATIASSQEFNVTDQIVIANVSSSPIPNDNVNLLPTPEPTVRLYPCDHIDPVINGSNCGACVANDSCIWCTSDQSCHVKSDYDGKQCTDPKSEEPADTITGSDHLYQCCVSSTSCEQCTTLEYVLCDWCIPSKQCFNASTETECHNGEDGDYGKHIVFKDGVCRDEEPETIWDKIKHYYLEIPFLFRCILDTLLALCFILMFFCCCLCIKNKIENRRRIRKFRNVRINESMAGASRPGDYTRFKESKWIHFAICPFHWIWCRYDVVIVVREVSTIVVDLRVYSSISILLTAITALTAGSLSLYLHIYF